MWSKVGRRIRTLADSENKRNLTTKMGKMQIHTVGRNFHVCVWLFRHFCGMFFTHWRAVGKTEEKQSNTTLWLPWNINIHTRIRVVVYSYSYSFPSIRYNIAKMMMMMQVQIYLPLCLRLAEL